MSPKQEKCPRCEGAGAVEELADDEIFWDLEWDHLMGDVPSEVAEVAGKPYTAERLGWFCQQQHAIYRHYTK